MAQVLQGTQANKTGSLLESTVRNTFSQKGFALRKFKDYVRGGLGEPEDVLLSHVPYISIYGHQGKTEFLALSPSRGLEMRIECKWQQSSGSVDEKFPYLMENCKIMPEPQVLVLVDGKGYKPGALQWLKHEAASYTAKRVLVMDVTEFLIWANTTL